MDKDVVGYLRSLKAVRERSRKVYEAAAAGELENFNANLPALSDVVHRVVLLIEVCCFENWNSRLTRLSERLWETITTQFHRMVDGSILRLAVWQG